MMNGADVLSEYAALAELSSQMLQAAEAGEWDQLVVLEQRCSAHVARLQRSEGSVELAPEGRQTKVDYIRSILADDRKIRDLVTPWMAHLSALLNNSGTQRRLAHAYGSV